MPRQKTGEKLGRPFLYTSDEERPVTVSLRIKRDLFDRLEAYRKIHRQSVTELLLEGLKWRLDEDEDPRWPSQNGARNYGNTVMREDTPTHSTATPAPLAGMDLTPDMLDAEDVEEMPREPENGSAVLLRQPVQSALSVPLDPADLGAMPVAPVAMPPQPVPAVSPPVSTLGDKASVLAQLHAWKAAGVSHRAMAAWLNAEHVPTFSGTGSWQQGPIGKLLAKHPAPVA
jgi:hypothetical protein